MRLFYNHLILVLCYCWWTLTGSSRPWMICSKHCDEIADWCQRTGQYGTARDWRSRAGACRERAQHILTEHRR